ncbi:hypothetical protein B0J13DRAFT_473497 [Dactylonectria estremocensis]|uniref:Uncharacterized protein n=1 Tax=Dactylonectria estremocensis TaxID=1079267 RepID=A0A9P9EY25_9HYPO|nr:hypothetical protein B0J13DRAFT_473497 [Dactylonectria estremocensis]
MLAMSSSTSPESSSISVVVIGWGRENGIIFMPRLFKEHKTPYVMTAMIDFVETLEPYRYSPKNLGAILHNLHPRPRALVIGIAVPPALVPEITGVWNEYIDTVLKEEFKENDEWKKNVCSTLPLTHYVDPSVGKPPMDMGWEREMFKHLDAAFRPEVSWE